MDTSVHQGGESEVGTQPADPPQPMASESVKPPVESQPVCESLPTAAGEERALNMSVPELSVPTETVPDAPVPLVSKASVGGASLEEASVRVSKVVAGNRNKNIPPKKNMMEPLKMDMSRPVVMPLTSSMLSLQCLECHIIFSDNKSRERHLKNNHPAQYTQVMLGDTLFFCYVCDRHFTTSADLMAHQRAHTEKPFKCPICSEAFGRSNELTAHKKAHFGLHGIPCSDCGKPCKTMTQIRYHRRTHSGEKPHVCKECGKKFIMLKSLQKHLEAHLKGAEGEGGVKAGKRKKSSGPGKYPCSLCKSTFKTAKTQLKHMKLKHPSCTTEPGGMPVITPTPMNILHLEPLGPLQRVDNIDTEQIRKLIESLGNVQRVNQLVVLGQVPPDAAPLNLQRIQAFGPPLQLRLARPQVELLELKQAEPTETQSEMQCKDTETTITLEPVVPEMHCKDTETTITLEPITPDDQMENPSLSYAHAYHAVIADHTEQTGVEPQQTPVTEETRCDQLPEPAETGPSAEIPKNQPMDQVISQSEAVEPEQVPEQAVVLELGSLVPTLEVELPASSSLLTTVELEQTSGQPLMDQEERTSVPTLTPTVELETPSHTDRLVELPTSPLAQTVAFTQAPPPEPSQTNRAQGTTLHTVGVHSTLETDSAEKSHEIGALDLTEKSPEIGTLDLTEKPPLDREREEMTSSGKSHVHSASDNTSRVHSVSDNTSHVHSASDNMSHVNSASDNTSHVHTAPDNTGHHTDIQSETLQASLPPLETKQNKIPDSPLPLPVMSVQEFVKIRKRKQANQQLQQETLKVAEKPSKRKITKKARMAVPFGPQEKKEKKSKKPKPSSQLPQKGRLAQDTGAALVSTQQEKKAPLKQKAVKEKKKKQEDVISKSEVKSFSILPDSQVQQLQVKPKKKTIKRQKDFISEGSEQTSEQEVITSPSPKKKKQQKTLDDRQPGKTKAGKLQRKGRKKKQKHKGDMSPLSAEMPDHQIITQESLLLLKGHKQPQLKVYKLDVAQAPDKPPDGHLQSQTNCAQSKDDALGQRKKGRKSKPLKMLTAGVKKKVGRPKKNQNALSLLTPPPTPSEKQPAKSKGARKRKTNPSDVETEGVISSQSQRGLACKDCGETFTEVSSLQGHKAAMHAVESPGLTYANGNVFEGVTGSDLFQPPKASEEEKTGSSINQNTFGMNVASDWDVEVEVGEMTSGDRDGRVSFPALNPSPSLPLAAAGVEEGGGCEERSRQTPPECSAPSHSPGLSLSGEVKTLLSGGQSPAHLTPTEQPLRSSHQTTSTEAGEPLEEEDKPEDKPESLVTHDALLPPGCTSEHQVPIDDDIKKELVLEVDLVTVGEQNGREDASSAHDGGSERILADGQIQEGSSCEAEGAPSPLDRVQTEKERTAGTRPSSRSCSSSTEQPEIKQEEEEILVQRREEEKKGGWRRARGRRRGSARGAGRHAVSLRRSLDGDGPMETDSEKDKGECRIVFQQERSPSNDSEIKDEAEAGASQTCLSAAPGLQPEIGPTSETRGDLASPASTTNVPASPEESPDDQVVFELESVTTSVEEMLKSEEGLGMERAVEKEDRESGQSPGVILERFLTSRQREGGDEEHLSDSSPTPHASQVRGESLEKHQHQGSVRSVLVKQEASFSLIDPQVTQGCKPTRWNVEQADVHSAPDPQTDACERTADCTVLPGARQCIFYPVKEEEREVLLEPSQSPPGIPDPSGPEEPPAPGQPVERQATSPGLYEINPAEEEYEVTRVRGAEINDFGNTGEDDLDIEHQNTLELQEFLLQSSNDEDSDVFELSDPQPDPEVQVMANFQDGQNHGRPHPNEIPNNVTTPKSHAPPRPRAESPCTQSDGEGSGCLKPIDYFLKYLDWDTWADIADCTNKLSNLPDPVTPKEVGQFVGIHIAMGTLKFPSQRLYWQDSTRVPLIADTMSASRFTQLSHKLRLASPAIDNVKDVRHNLDVGGTHQAGISSHGNSPKEGLDTCGEDKSRETPADPIAESHSSSGHSQTNLSPVHAHGTKRMTAGNSVADRNGQSSSVKMDPLWRVRPLLDRVQAGCMRLARVGDHGVDQYPVHLTAGAVNNNNRPSLHSTVLLGSSGMILHLDLNLDLSDKEATVEKMVPRDGGVVFLCKQELSTPAMLERLLVAGVHGAGRVGGARGEVGDEYVSSDGKLMLRRSHDGFVLSTVGKGQHNMASLIGSFEKARRAARLNRDLCRLYGTPLSATPPSAWPQAVLWYLTDVALVNSWLHYRQDRAPGPLSLMAFRLEVSEALILPRASDTQDSLPPQPPAQKLHTPDTADPALSPAPNPALLQEDPLPDASVRYDGSSHWPEHAGEGQGGQCRFGGCERTSQVRCLKCCVFLCISRNHNCFLKFHNRESF